jgi:hypothetical protein
MTIVKLSKVISEGESTPLRRIILKYLFKKIREIRGERGHPATNMWRTLNEVSAAESGATIVNSNAKDNGQSLSGMSIHATDRVTFPTTRYE